MWPSQRLLFYIVPPTKKDDSPPIARAGRTLVLMIVAWGALFVAGLLIFPSTCSDTPDSSLSTQATNTACSPSYALNAALIVAALALAIVALYPVVTHFRPPRSLALWVTAAGLESVYSRWVGVISWEQIETLDLYEAVTYSSPGNPARYLAVTLHSPEGLHDEPTLERIWRHYPLAPDMERVAIMLPLTRLTDANGARISPVEMLERIQICFPDQITANGIEFTEDVRLI